jgi:DNA repair protein RadD
MFQLRGYQKEAVEAGLDLLSSKKQKNGLLVEPTGSGKSLIIGKIIERTNKKTILLQPTKEILEQNLSKLRKFGVEDIGIYSASMGEKSVGSTTIATIGTIIKRKEKFNDFDQLIIDECFTGDTLISMPSGKKRIDKVRLGDIVYNAAGIGEVLAISKKTIKEYYVVNLSNGKSIKCTGNHPFLSESGWIECRNLVEGSIIISIQNMPELWEGIYSLEKCKNNTGRKNVCKTTLLLNILLEEDGECNVGDWRKRKDDKDSKEDRAQTIAAWWKRTINHTPKEIIEDFGERLDPRVSYKNKCSQNIKNISNMLQSGHRKSKVKDCNRDRWEKSHRETGKTGSKKGSVSNIIRVESIKIKKQICNEPVYNLQVSGHPSYFAENVLVHNCHLCNSKGGQYEEFINHLNIPVIGLTATPFRMKYYMNTYGNGDPVVESRFLTRTRPRIFNTISHITQVTDMFNQGYLCPIDYDYKNDYDSKKIKSNSTGQGYNEDSLEKYNKEQNIVSKIINEVTQSKAKHILIFTHFTSESKQVVEALQKYNISCAEVSGQTSKSDREEILKKFQLGIIRCVVNVGVLTVGFDFPELDHIIIGRPTKSLTLFYQISGRGLRLSDGKECCKLTDLCDNIKRFGEINSFFIEDISNGNELWRLKSNIGYLTGVNLITGKDLENRQMTTHKEKKKAEKGDLKIPFGKFKDKKLSEIDDGYLKWAVDNFDKGKWKTIFKNEIDRRNS